MPPQVPPDSRAAHSSSAGPMPQTPDEIIASLQARMLSDEEISYIRSRKLSDERASWAWQMIRTYAPWVITMVSAFGSAAYWLVTHVTFKGAP